MKKTGLYKSEKLLKPIPLITTFGELMDSNVSRDRISAEFVDRLLLLFEEYGIDIDQKGQWSALALRLAVDHVPGFQVKDAKKKGGRPRIWHGYNALKLYADFSKLVQEGKSARNAATILVNRDEYKNYADTGLLRRYKEIQSNLESEGWSAESAIAYMDTFANLGEVEALAKSNAKTRS